MRKNKIGIEWLKVVDVYKRSVSSDEYTLGDWTSLNLSEKKWNVLKDTFRS